MEYDEAITQIAVFTHIKPAIVDELIVAAALAMVEFRRVGWQAAGKEGYADGIIHALYVEAGRSDEAYEAISDAIVTRVHTIEAAAYD